MQTELRREVAFIHSVSVIEQFPVLVEDVLFKVLPNLAETTKNDLEFEKS